MVCISLRDAARSAKGLSFRHGSMRFGGASKSNEFAQLEHPPGGELTVCSGVLFAGFRKRNES